MTPLTGSITSPAAPGCLEESETGAVIEEIRSGQRPGDITMSLLQRIRAKQKADAEKAALRLEKRRGYARAARERALQAANGLADLPDVVAVAIEQQLSAAPEPAPEPPKPDASGGLGREALRNPGAHLPTT
jgi:hypothetical protein